jgi:hypothetical protein
VSQIYNEEQLDSFFASSEPANPFWIGGAFQVTSGQEVIPFVFNGIRYLFILGTPLSEAGDETTLYALCAEFTDGFVPDENSRVIKFCRADAIEYHFDPKKWSLDEPKQIHQFGAVVSTIVERYVLGHPEVQQFFFSPASDKLGTLYQRLYRRLNNEGLAGKFLPILEPLGVFNGYQRSQA